MKFIGTVKKKTLEYKEIDMVLTIDEIDKLIDFLNHSKKAFVERQKDCSVKRLIEKDGEFRSENITSYKKIVEMGSEVLNYHLHYKDWCESITGYKSQTDIVVHAVFKAEKNDDDSFSWKEDNEDI